jgi:hypothetical protein
LGVSPGNPVFAIMGKMDVYLSDEVLQHLSAQALKITRGAASGLLLGHRRGPRFFVERIYPCPLRTFLSVGQYHALSRIFDDKIIGFYSSRRRTEKRKPKFPPFAVNKLYLEFDPHPKKGLTLRPAVVEYTGFFQLVPVELARPPGGRK